MYCRLPLKRDSMSIKVTDSMRSGVLLARVCSFEHLVAWAQPFVDSPRKRAEITVRQTKSSARIRELEKVVMA